MGDEGRLSPSVRIVTVTDRALANSIVHSHICRVQLESGVLVRVLFQLEQWRLPQRLRLQSAEKERVSTPGI